MGQEPVAVLATALKARMIYLVRECAWFALRRYGGDRGDRVYFDVPMARMALLKAETVVIGAGKTVSDTPPQGVATPIEDLRSEAVAAVTLDNGIGRREEGTVRSDLGVLVDLTAPKTVERKLTVADILSCLESDALVASAALFQWRIP
jgi:hypothetical protein